MHVHKLIDCLDHKLTFHAGLCSDVVVAVPADVELSAEALAEEQIDQHLSWNQLPEDVPVHEEVAVLRSKLPHNVAVGSFVVIGFGGSPQRFHQPTAAEAVNYPRHRPHGLDTALTGYGGLFHADGRAAVQRAPVARQAAQIGKHANLLCIKSESKNLIG